MQSLVPAALTYALRTVAGPGQPQQSNDSASAGQSDDALYNAPDGDAVVVSTLHDQQKQLALRTMERSLGPTLLPRDVAMLVSAVSLAARVSLRCVPRLAMAADRLTGASRASALFLEAALEGARLTSLTSLGITRRALIGAISSARALHYMRERLGWEGQDGTEYAVLTELISKQSC
jgi:hypothetical protein